MRKIVKNILNLVTLIALSIPFSGYAAQPLQVTEFNAAKDSLFDVNSFIISNDKEAVLIDAQFQKNDAQRLAQVIKQTGKKLTAIYISHSDPDYYFGLAEINQVFPNTPILATAETVAAIEANYQAKLDFWGEKLAANKPKKIIIPTVYNQDSLSLGNSKIIIEGKNPQLPGRTAIWLPATKTLLPGIDVNGSKEHLWLADSKTLVARQAWLAHLAAMLQLKPQQIYASHSKGTSLVTSAAIEDTIKYIQDFNAADVTTKNAQELVKAMQAKYPSYPAGYLELSAGVVKNEISW